MKSNCSNIGAVERNSLCDSGRFACGEGRCLFMELPQYGRVVSDLWPQEDPGHFGLVCPVFT